MCKYWKFPLYLIFATYVMTLNNVYSGFLDDLASKTLETIEQGINEIQKETIDKTENRPTQPQKRNEGSSVPDVQDRLNKLGYNAGPANGVFREKTRQAIRAFERDHNMIVDGQITDRLITALRNNNNSAVYKPNADIHTTNPHAGVAGSTNNLAGRWLCYLRESYDDDAVAWIDIRATGDGIAAELDLDEKLALAGKYNPDDNTFSLNPTRWVSDNPARYSQPLGFEGHYVAKHDVLYGKVLTNIEGFSTFVAMRDIPPREIPENHRGLLNKITTNKESTESLSIEDCRQYAEWLASGQSVLTGSTRSGRYSINDAVVNLDKMSEVLGRNILQWQEQDTVKIKLIGNYCRRKLASSTNLNDNSYKQRVGRWVPDPFNAPKYGRNNILHGTWQATNLLLKKDLIASAKALKMRFDEGFITIGKNNPGGAVAAQEFEGWEALAKRIANGGAAVQTSGIENRNGIRGGRFGSAAVQIPGLENSSGITGIWRGRYGCSTSNINRNLNRYQPGGKDFIRLIMKREGNTINGVIEFGPSLTSRSNRGAFTVSGEMSNESGEFKLSPQQWIFQAHGLSRRNTNPFGLMGKLNVEDGTIEGKVLAAEECSTFKVKRLIMPDKPKNPDGLLFKISEKPPYRHTLTKDDYVKYANWLAGGENIKIGNHTLNTLVKDFDGMRSVLGKDFYQIDKEDKKKLHTLDYSCRKMFSNSMDIEIIELFKKIHNLHIPIPLNSPKDMKNDWIITEQLIYASEDALMFASKQLRDLKAMPPKHESLRAVDQAINEVTKAQGDFMYMSAEERKGHKNNLLTFQSELKNRIYDEDLKTAISHLAGYEKSADGLAKMEAFWNTEQNVLKRRGDQIRWKKLEVVFIQEAGIRAEVVLPEKLQKNMKALESLSDATYDRLDEFKAIYNETTKITQFYERHNLPKSPALEQSYQNYQKDYAESYGAMIDRSSDKLVQWIEEHPNDEAAMKELNAFSLKLFDTEWRQIPDRYAKIRDAITEISDTIKREEEMVAVAFKAMDEIAHPNDPQNPKGVKGISDEELAEIPVEEIAELIKITLPYAEQNSQEPRYLFALGRAAWIHGDEEFGAELLLKAAKLGSPAANAYLAHTTDDVEKKANHLHQAAQGGFEPAREWLNELKLAYEEEQESADDEQQTVAVRHTPKKIHWPMDFTQFAQPQYMEAFHSGNTQQYASGTVDAVFLMSYISKVSDTLNDQGVLFLLERPKEFLRELDPTLSFEAGKKVSTDPAAMDQMSGAGLKMMLGMLVAGGQARSQGASIGGEMAAMNKAFLGEDDEGQGDKGKSISRTNIIEIKESALKDARTLAFLFEERPEDFRKIYQGMVKFVRE